MFFFFLFSTETSHELKLGRKRPFDVQHVLLNPGIAVDREYLSI